MTQTVTHITNSDGTSSTIKSKTTKFGCCGWLALLAVILAPAAYSLPIAILLWTITVIVLGGGLLLKRKYP